MTPIQRAVLTALIYAGNQWAAQKLIVALLKEDERQHGPSPSLLDSMRQAAIAKALGAS